MVGLTTDICQDSTIFGPVVYSAKQIKTGIGTGWYKTYPIILGNILLQCTDRNILVNFLQVVIYLALVANIQHETWEKNDLQVKSIETILLVLSNFFQKS